MKLTIDFETRSECDIKKAGPWIYSEHPSTEVICMAIKVDNEPTKLWVVPYFYGLNNMVAFHEVTKLPFAGSLHEDRVKILLTEADTIEAHNAFFEKAIYKNILLKQGWPKIPDHKWRCSAAKAASFALPRTLEGAGEALGLSITKDKQGYFNMLKICKPRKPTKDNKAKWHEDPEDFLNLFKYCINDVDSEHALSQVLRDLSAREQQIWSVDQTINERGVYVDVEAAKAAISLIDKHEEQLLIEFRGITKIDSPKQVAKTLNWFNNITWSKDADFKLADLTKDNVAKSLKRKDLPYAIRRALEIRQSLSKSSTAKFNQMVIGSSPDQRMRDTLVYHGAAPGRWAGKRLQLHNMPRKMTEGFEELIDMLPEQDLETIELLYGDLMQALSGSIRAFICAPPGRELICADYASIEGRILAWLAEEEYILQNYRDGKDPYCVFASQLTGLSYDEIYQGYKKGIKKYVDDIRFNGKTGELACGYQGGEQAIKKFAPDMPRARRKEIVKIWRSNRPKTVKFWGDMEKYAIAAVRTGKTYTWNNIKWGMKGDFLHCRLPSGRLLSYYKPVLRTIKMYAYMIRDLNLKIEEGDSADSWDLVWSRSSKEKEGIRSLDNDFSKLSIRFMGIDSNTKQWTKKFTYGGKLVENIVQGVARDYLAEALVRVEESHYPVVLHVHDEIISEVPEGTGDVKEFVSIMTDSSEWGKTCPIEATGFRTNRYQKG